MVVEGIAAERFLITTPPGNERVLTEKGTDYDAWIGQAAATTWMSSSTRTWLQIWRNCQTTWRVLPSRGGARQPGQADVGQAAEELAGETGAEGPGNEQDG